MNNLFLLFWMKIVDSFLPFFSVFLLIVCKIPPAKDETSYNVFGPLSSVFIASINPLKGCQNSILQSRWCIFEARLVCATKNHIHLLFWQYNHLMQYLLDFSLLIYITILCPCLILSHLFFSGQMESESSLTSTSVRHIVNLWTKSFNVFQPAKSSWWSCYFWYQWGQLVVQVELKMFILLVQCLIF